MDFAEAQIRKGWWSAQAKSKAFSTLRTQNARLVLHISQKVHVYAQSVQVSDTPGL